MVGKLNLSPKADAVRHLFMGLEQNAKKIKLCWLCGSALPILKLANQGFLSGNHKPNCPFEEVALAAEECIKWRDEKQHAQEREKRLSEKTDALLAANATIRCPLCDPGFSGEHAYGCPFRDLSYGSCQSKEDLKAEGVKETSSIPPTD